MGIVQDTLVQPLMQALVREFNGHITTENIEPRSLNADQVLREGSLGAAPLAALVDLTKPVVTSLPSSPTDGEVIFFQSSGMATNGQVWTLKYRPASASAYDWEFVGGSPLFAEVVTEETRNNGAYGALATAGPSITVPLAGDYNVEIGARLFPPSAGGLAMMSYDIGATGAVDADAIRAAVDAAGTQFYVNSARRRVKTALAASTVLVAKYRTAGVAAFADRFMAVTPVRVG